MSCIFQGKFSLGKVYVKLGQYPIAMSLFEECLDFARERKDNNILMLGSKHLLEVWSNLSCCYKCNNWKNNLVFGGKTCRGHCMTCISSFIYFCRKLTLKLFGTCIGLDILIIMHNHVSVLKSLAEKTTLCKKLNMSGPWKH